MPYNHVYDYFRWFWSVDGDLDWLIIHQLGQVVDYDENRVIAVAFPVSKKR